MTNKPNPGFNLLFPENLKKADANLSPTKQMSFDDLGDFIEEREKIKRVVENSIDTTLKVDYSQFSNHVFFDSAVAKFNVAKSRVLTKYPYNGTKEEKDAFHLTSSDYEDYIFNAWPKHVGYLEFNGSNQYVSASDANNNLVPVTSSLYVSAWLKNPKVASYDMILQVVSASTGPIKKYGYELYLSGANLPYIKFSIYSGSEKVTFGAPYSAYTGSANNVAVLYDRPANMLSLYINNVVQVTGNVNLNSIEFRPITAYVGSGSQHGAASASFSFYSGSLDEIRVAHTSSEIYHKKNYGRPIDAEPFVKLHYKFNEGITGTGSIDSIVVDYSKSGIHGKIINYTSSVRVSGTTMFNDYGDPILYSFHSGVAAFTSSLDLTASIYDINNNNSIFNLLPEAVLNEDEDGLLTSFSLGMARFFDEIKLYIDQFDNLKVTNYDGVNETPDVMLPLLTKYFGWKITDHFGDTGALPFFFGENVLSSGSMDVSLLEIRNQFWRRILNNLPYLLKTKGKRNNLDAFFNVLGINQNNFSIKEYGYLPGNSISNDRIHKQKPVPVIGIGTGSIPQTGSYIKAPSVIGSTQLGNNYTVESLVQLPYSSASYSASLTTGSIWQFTTTDSARTFTFAWVRSPNSDTGKFLLTGSDGQSYTTTNCEVFTGDFVHLAVGLNTALPFVQVRTLDTTNLKFSASFVSVTALSGVFTASSYDFIMGANSGTNQTYGTHGFFSEYRVWNRVLSASELDDHAYNFQSIGISNPAEKPNPLLGHWSLNENSASDSSGRIDKIQDYSRNGKIATGSLFPVGENAYQKFLFNYNYLSPSIDLKWTDNKIRIRNKTELTINDVANDTNEVSLEFNLIDSLNEDISKIFSSFDILNQTIGKPVNKYRDEYSDLENLRRVYFDRLGDSLNFTNFFKLFRWFDKKLSDSIKQLLPARVKFIGGEQVVESHFLERPKYGYKYPIFRTPKPIPEITASIRPIVSSSLMESLKTETSVLGTYSESYMDAGKKYVGRNIIKRRESVITPDVVLSERTVSSYDDGNDRFNRGKDLPFINNPIINTFFHSKFHTGSLPVQALGFTPTNGSNLIAFYANKGLDSPINSITQTGATWSKVSTDITGSTLTGTDRVEVWMAHNVKNAGTSLSFSFGANNLTTKFFWLAELRGFAPNESLTFLSSAYRFEGLTRTAPSVTASLDGELVFGFHTYHNNPLVEGYVSVSNGFAKIHSASVSDGTGSLLSALVYKTSRPQGNSVTPSIVIGGDALSGSGFNVTVSLKSQVDKRFFPTKVSGDELYTVNNSNTTLAYKNEWSVRKLTELERDNKDTTSSNTGSIFVNRRLGNGFLINAIDSSKNQDHYFSGNKKVISIKGKAFLSGTTQDIFVVTGSDNSPVTPYPILYDKNNVLLDGLDLNSLFGQSDSIVRIPNTAVVQFRVSGSNVPFSLSDIAVAVVDNAGATNLYSDNSPIVTVESNGWRFCKYQFLAPSSFYAYVYPQNNDLWPSFSSFFGLYVNVSASVYTFKDVEIYWNQTLTNDGVEYFQSIDNQNTENISGFLNSAVNRELPNSIYNTSFTQFTPLNYPGNGPFIEDSFPEFASGKMDIDFTSKKIYMLGANKYEDSHLNRDARLFVLDLESPLSKTVLDSTSYREPSSTRFSSFVKINKYDNSIYYSVAASGSAVLKKSTTGLSGSFIIVDSITGSMFYDIDFSGSAVYIAAATGTFVNGDSRLILRYSNTGDSGTFSTKTTYSTNSPVPYGISIRKNEVYVCGKRFPTAAASGTEWFTIKSTDTGSNFTLIDNYQRTNISGNEAFKVLAYPGSNAVFVLGAEDDSGWLLRLSVSGNATFTNVDSYQTASAEDDITAFGLDYDKFGRIYLGAGVGKADAGGPSRISLKRSPTGASGTWTNLIDHTDHNSFDAGGSMVFDRKNNEFYWVFFRDKGSANSYADFNQVYPYVNWNWVGIVNCKPIDNKYIFGKKMFTNSLVYPVNSSSYGFMTINNTGFFRGTGLPLATYLVGSKLLNVSEFNNVSKNAILGTQSTGRIGNTDDSLIKVTHVGSVVYVVWPKQDIDIASSTGFGDLSAGQKIGVLSTEFQDGDIINVENYDHMSLYCYMLKGEEGTDDSIEIKIQRRPLASVGFATEPLIEYGTSGSFATATLRDLIYKIPVNYGDLSLKEIGTPIDVPLVNTKQIKIQAKQMNGQSSVLNKNLIIWARLIKTKEET